jgi:hypothetical protein
MSDSLVQQEDTEKDVALLAAIKAGTAAYPAFIASQSLSEFFRLASAGDPAMRSAVAADPRCFESWKLIIAEAVSHEEKIASEDYFEKLTLVPFNDLYYEFAAYYLNRLGHNSEAMKSVIRMFASAMEDDTMRDRLQWMWGSEGEPVYSPEHSWRLPYQLVTLIAAAEMRYLTAPRSN